MQVQHERVHFLTMLYLSNVISKFCTDNNFLAKFVVIDVSNVPNQHFNAVLEHNVPNKLRVVIRRIILLASKFATQIELTHGTSHDVTTRVALDGYLHAALLYFFYSRNIVYSE